MTTYDSGLGYDNIYPYDGVGPAIQTNSGWYFLLEKPSGKRVPLYPTISGSFSYDGSREVTKALSGFVLLPSEYAKINFTQDVVLAFLLLNSETHFMGVFVFSELVIQKDVCLDPDNPTVVSDLYNVALADRTALLIRSEGNARTLFEGGDPSFEMREILSAAGQPHSIANAAAPTGSDITWDGSATDLEKIRSLATLAGHRQPWMNNEGVIKSVSSMVIDTDVIPLEDLYPTGGSISITEKYLTAPNRVIVNDNSFPNYALRGQWDAPGSAPHSYANRGFYYTVTEDTQGLQSEGHADTVAATLGESYTARTLAAEILPTQRLDGPQVIGYDGSFWLVNSWSMGTDSGATMSIQAEELLV